MAKKTRKKAAAKAAKTAKTSSKKKVAQKKAVAKKFTTKAATAKSPKATVPKKPPAPSNLASKPAQPSLLRKVENKVAGAFRAITDTLVDAEQLHEKLDPGISREPE
jgi:hypothetical protein